VLTANVSGGAVTSLTIINAGTGYTTAPTIVVGASYGVYIDPIQVGLDFGTSSETYNQAVVIFQQSGNILTGGGQLIVYPMASTDTLSLAITALSGQIYTGAYIYAGYTPTASEVEAASSLVNAFSTKRIMFAPTNLLTDLYSGGMSFTISQAQQQQTRLLIHTAGATTARLFAAGYASRLLSTNFYEANATLTMNLKQIIGVPVDTGINETIAAQCQTVGVDFYASAQSLPEVISTGGNGYSDNVFNMTWLLNALQVSTFNFLGTTPTKIPQTEAGMTALKQAMTAVLVQAVTNGFLAPGAWTATTFGNPATLIRNIADFGYYIYSQPVSQQFQSQRQARIAPLVQIAVKFAGAIQSVNGIIYINP
jgi:hypothetical protein